MAFLIDKSVLVRLANATDTQHPVAARAPAWKALVGALGVIGKQVHDARLVAVCHAHAVTHLLTFTITHFGRMAGFGPGVVVVDPATV